MTRLSLSAAAAIALLTALPAPAQITGSGPVLGVTTRSYAPGESDDPRIRSARFLGYDQRQYSALTELLNMRQDGRWELMPEDYQWLLAQAHVDFAMRGSAMPIYDSLAETTSDSLLLARSRLRLAELQFQRGYTAQCDARKPAEGHHR
jgi:hypothetical protein